MDGYYGSLCLKRISGVQGVEWDISGWLVGGYFLGTMNYFCSINVGVFESYVIVTSAADWLAYPLFWWFVLTRNHLRVDVRFSHGKEGCGEFEQRYNLC